MLLGTEGLALLRLAAMDDAAACDARVGEMRTLLDRYDGELAAPLATPNTMSMPGYELWSATYDAPLRLFPVEEPTVRSLLAQLPPGRILDAACGTGRHSEWLAAPRPRADRRRRLAGHARQGASQDSHGRFEQGDLAGLPLADGSVDAVLCALALVHLPDLRPAMAEFARVVRPGGGVVISDVHPFLTTLGWQAQFRTAAGGAGFVRLHRHLPSSYAQAAAEAGLTVVNLFEPLLPADAAVTVAQGPIPAANAVAWAGLPGVIVWDLIKPAPG